jgi:hypothetical protein
MYQQPAPARQLQGRLRMNVQFTLCGVLILGSVCVGQTPVPDKVPETTFRVGTDLVLLNVSVFDQAWKVIKGLPKSAFTVLENGVKQEISVFRQPCGTRRCWEFNT